MVVSILLNGCTTWTLTKRLEKKLDGNYTIMLRAILNKSWRQHPTKHQVYGHLPPIYIIIVIILSCHQHGYPKTSLATPHYLSSLLAAPQGYITYPHRAAVVCSSWSPLSRPCEGVHRKIWLMSSSLLLQHCPACLIRLTWIFFLW